MILSDDNRHHEKSRFPVRNQSGPKISLSVNRAKFGIRYKSELCVRFQREKCYRGQNCHFAHSVREVRNPAFVKEHADEDGKRYNYFPNFKTYDCCKYFVRGVDCPFGKSCRYAHKSYDDKLGFRKTRLCWQWQRFGSCPYGVKCLYAHGNGELQEVSGCPSLPDNAAESSDEVGIKITKKLQLKDRSYFKNWDISRISQIYADNPIA